MINNMIMKLREWFPKERIPRVPPKHFLRSGISKELVEERKELLQKYVDELLSIPKISSSSQFIQWFYPSNDVRSYLNHLIYLIAFMWSDHLIKFLLASICISG